MSPDEMNALLVMNLLTKMRRSREIRNAGIRAQTRWLPS